MPPLDKNLFHSLSPKRKLEFLDSLSETEKLFAPYMWRDLWARSEQIAPPGDWLHWVAIAGRGWGKGFRVDTIIPTPSGWVEIGDMQAGDALFDEQGRVCHVAEAHVPYEAEEHRFVFSDGAELVACIEHQWVTWTHADRKAFLRSVYERDASRFPVDWPNWRVARLYGGRGADQASRLFAASLAVNEGVSLRRAGVEHGCCRGALANYMRGGGNGNFRSCPDGPGPRIRTTAEIMATLLHGKRSDLNHCIPTCAPLDLPHVDLPIAPYTLGLWLGDGASNDGTICGAEYEVFENVVADGYKIGHWRRDSRSPALVVARIEGLRLALRREGLLGNKHVPPVYLRSSIAQRLALLRGLMDSDGYAEDSKVEFCNTNRALIDAVYELAASLGQKPVIGEGVARFRGRDYGSKWRVTWRATFNPFALRRKAERVRVGQAQSLRNHHRMIEAVEPTGRKVEMRCLTVDSPNSMYLVGRAMIPTHNTKTGSEWVREKKETCGRIAIVAETAADARDVVVDGESGILACSPPWDRPHFEPSKRRITWDNGAYATLYSGEDPEQLRGPQHSAAWVDEFCKYRYASELWIQLKMGLRIAPIGGGPPQVFISTTPKNVPAFKKILAHPRTVQSYGNTFDNKENLSEEFIDDIKATYEGTSLGQQELYARLLDENEGALWTRALIEQNRHNDRLPTIRDSVIGVDPATARKRNMTGIVGVSKAHNGHAYVRADATGRYSPGEWAKRSVEMFYNLEASCIVAEGNQGGEMVRKTIHSYDPLVPVIIVHARQGKQARAEPIVALYEQGLIHHQGSFPMLEDQMVTWEPESGDESPDRIDALVWACRRLMLKARPRGAGAAPVVISG